MIRLSDECIRELVEFAEAVYDDNDCNPDNHRYGMGCRMCDATRVLANLRKQCPECHGSVIPCVDFDGNAFHPTRHGCSTCEGTGTVQVPVDEVMGREGGP